MADHVHNFYFQNFERVKYKEHVLLAKQKIDETLICLLCDKLVSKAVECTKCQVLLCQECSIMGCNKCGEAQTSSNIHIAYKKLLENV
jgi:hypothetical protein